MSPLFLTIALALGAAAPPQEPAPDPELVKTTVSELRSGLREREVAARVRALTDAMDVLDSEVIVLIASGLKDDDVRVIDTALDCLRSMKHPESLEQLHKALRKNKALKEQEELHVKLLKAVAAHGDASSIPFLTDKMFSKASRKTTQARILALGKIRDPESVKTLFDVMKSGARQRIQPHMDDFRLALGVLTGADEGKSQDAWLAWWNNNKKTLAVSAQPPRMPKSMQASWDRYWGHRRQSERPRERSKRGGDPERGE